MPGPEVGDLELGQPPRLQQPEQREPTEHHRRQRDQRDRGEELHRPAHRVTSAGSDPVSMRGRTSIAKNPAFGHRAAISVARSMVSQSTIRKPPKCSFASANGPSVTAGTPFLTRTVFVFDGSASPAPVTNSPDSASSFMIVSTSPISAAPSGLETSRRVSEFS